MAPMTKQTALTRLYLNRDPDFFYTVQKNEFKPYTNKKTELEQIRQIVRVTGIYTPALEKYIEKNKLDIDLSKYRLIENYKNIVIDPENITRDQRIKSSVDAAFNADLNTLPRATLLDPEKETDPLLMSLVTLDDIGYKMKTDGRYTQSQIDLVIAGLRFGDQSDLADAFKNLANAPRKLTVSEIINGIQEPRKEAEEEEEGGEEELVRETGKKELVRETEEEETEGELKAKVFRGAFEKEEEPYDVDAHVKYTDEMRESMTIKGHPKEFVDKIIEMSKSFDEKAIKNIIDTVNENEGIVDLSQLFSEEPRDLTVPAVGPVVNTGAVVPDPKITSADDPAITTEPEKPPLELGTGVSVMPFIDRYHPTSILLYFGNVSMPNWDLVLEKNVLSLDLGAKERAEMMDDILLEYGNKMFIQKRKGDTLKELNELIQLQFTIMRNLHTGARNATASVKLDDLIKIDRLAGGSGGPTIGSVGGGGTTVGGGGPIIQTKSESNFIKDYDDLTRKQVLGDSLLVNKEVRINKTGFDARTHGILPGNNLNAAQTTRIRKS